MGVMHWALALALPLVAALVTVAVLDAAAAIKKFVKRKGQQ